MKGCTFAISASVQDVVLKQDIVDTRTGRGTKQDRRRKDFFSYISTLERRRDLSS